jgi:hypothetical protein
MILLCGWDFLCEVLKYLKMRQLNKIICVDKTFYRAVNHTVEMKKKQIYQITTCKQFTFDINSDDIFTLIGSTLDCQYKNIDRWIRTFHYTKTFYGLGCILYADYPIDMDGENEKCLVYKSLGKKEVLELIDPLNLNDILKGYTIVKSIGSSYLCDLYINGNNSSIGVEIDLRSYIHLLKNNL